MHYNFLQPWERWRKSLPNPYRQILARRILQSTYLVEIAMIKLVHDRLKCRAYLREVLHPAKFTVHIAADVDFYSERMSMQPRTFMVIWDVR